MVLPKWATTVTPLSKTIALTLFITLPFLGFYFGIRYQQMKMTTEESQLILRVSNSPTEIPTKLTNSGVVDSRGIYTNKDLGISFKIPTNYTVALDRYNASNEWDPQDEGEIWLRSSINYYKTIHIDLNNMVDGGRSVYEEKIKIDQRDAVVVALITGHGTSDDDPLYKNLTWETSDQKRVRVSLDDPPRGYWTISLPTYGKGDSTKLSQEVAEIKAFVSTIKFLK